MPKKKSKPKTGKTHLVMKIPSKVLALIAYARGLASALTANASIFVKPTPPVSQITSDADALEKAEAAMKTDRTATGARDKAHEQLVKTLHAEGDYIEALCNASPDHADAIAQAAGLSVKRPGGNRAIQGVKAAPGENPGDVKLTAGGGGVAHEFETSLDGVSFTSQPATSSNKLTVSGFKVGQILFVRHRAVLRHGHHGPWSQVVSYVVR